MPRSCPPPKSTPVGDGERTASSSPVPLGPPNLWALAARVVAPDCAKDTGMWPTACTASICTGVACPAAADTTSLMGWMVPVSLLAHMQLTNAAGVSNVSPTPTIPEGETGSQLTSAPAPAASPRTVSNAAGCSMDELTMRRESLARYSPWMAMLSASVPDAVKITSMGSQSSSKAISSRACSRAARARRPVAYCPPGLSSVDASNHASRAQSRMGVVAAWSR